MQSSLQRLLLGLTSVAIVVVTLGGLGLNLQHRISEAKARMAAQTERMAAAGAPLLLNSLIVGDLASAEQTLRNLNADTVWRQVRLYEADGQKLILDTSPEEPPSSTAPAWFRRLLPLDLRESRLAISAPPVTYGVLAVRPAAANLHGELWEETRITVGVGLVLLCTLLGLLKVILAYGLRPVQALGESAERLGSGDLGARMPPTHLAEVAPTVRAFNAMAENLEQLLAELRAKEAANRRLAASVEQAEDAIITIDLEHRVTSWNLGARRLFGRSADEMIGQSVRALFSPAPAEADAQVARLLETSARGRLETAFPGPGGDLVWVAASCSPLQTDAGTPDGHIIVARDVTAAKRAADALRRAKEAAEAGNRAKAEFLAVMSHEIRTPMNGIIGMTDLLMETDLDAEQRESLGLVKLSANALLQVINDILDFSKIEAGRIEIEAIDFSVRTTIGHALKSFALRADEKRLELASSIAPEVPDALVGDPGRLRQILVNLVGNAMKFTEHGEIVVRVDGAPAADGAVELHFAVSDTGIGIPAAKLDHIFGAFTQADSTTTRRYGGTGLGLAITKRLVELMGGRIWVESEEHRGSTFHFTARFGLVAAPAPETMPLDPVHLRGLPALVVDDNATARRVLGDMLAHAGLRPIVVPSVEDAWAALTRARAQGELPALVVTDHQMPGCDGFGLAARLKADPGFAKIAIVMVSSAGLPADARRARETGIDAYLTKPVTSAELLEAVRGVLASPEPPPAAADPAPAATPEDAATGALRVLLAEDNAVNQRVAVRMLEKLGHRVAVVGTGRAALAALDAEAFDLVLMDVQMPEMDGIEATATIRAGEAEVREGRRQPLPASSYAAHRGTGIPIVALTAHVLNGNAERCLAAGMDDYLSKPFKAEALVEIVERYAGGRPSDRAPRASTVDA